MSFDPGTVATLAPLAGFAVATAARADHEVRSLRSPALGQSVAELATQGEHLAESADLGDRF